MSYLVFSSARKIAIAAAISTSFTAGTQAFANIYLRGSHNSWAAEPMLYGGYYLSEDIITFKNCLPDDKVEFKFDMRGDWSENFGDNDNIRGLNPSRNIMEGRLDQNGSNIRIDCNKTYVISATYPYGAEGYYGYREISAQVPETLQEGQEAAFRKAIRGGGFYGAVSITGEVLVKPIEGNDSSESRTIEVTTRDSQGNSPVVEAKYYKTLENGLELWRFEVGSYGSIELISIALKQGEQITNIEIVPELVQ